MPNYYTYIIYSPSRKVFYRGQTNNIEDRFWRHTNGLVGSTKSGAPWVLIWFVTKGTRSESVVLELKLKNLSTRRLAKFVMKYKEEIQSDKASKIIERYL